MEYLIGTAFGQLMDPILWVIALAAGYLVRNQTNFFIRFVGVSAAVLVAAYLLSADRNNLPIYFGTCLIYGVIVSKFFFKKRDSQSPDS